ncbi:MAG: hypothetical protein HDT46_03460 [Ruminococcaceae bacterium]|nr:hypothetical protein [Oscillospiraceae bacterium]
MNSRQSNEKIIQILSEMEPIREESDEERARRERMTEEAKNAVEDAPLAFPRKVAGIVCIALWAFSLVALMFGFGDLGVLLPFMLLSLGAVSGLNIPVFIKKGKIFDVAVAVVACAICAAIAFSVLFVGGNR